MPAKNADLSKVAAADNAFALDLYAHLREHDHANELANIHFRSAVKRKKYCHG